MPAKDALSAAVKQGMLTLGQYRRTLARTTLPGVAVLGYHGLRADDLPAGSMAFENLHVRASTFDAHCRVVRECCDPITLDDWREAAAGRTPLPPRPVLITFDDGYRSVARIGAPILAAPQTAGGRVRLQRPDRQPPPALVRRRGGPRRRGRGRAMEDAATTKAGGGVRRLGAGG